MTMKKNLMKVMGVALVAVLGLLMGACKGCSKVEIGSLYHDYDGAVQDFTAGTSQVQELHRQTMFSLIGGKKYQWRNSRVILNDTLSADNFDDLHVVAVNDVFFYWDDHKGPMVQYINSHVKYGVQIPFPINDVWIEDADMSDKGIKLSAEDALNKLKEWNGVLPQGCNSITLRYPVGSKDCNAQWVIGDVYDVLFIDAVTGEIRDWNPAFPRE